jgi:hypothetical protein
MNQPVISINVDELVRIQKRVTQRHQRKVVRAGFTDCTALLREVLGLHCQMRDGSGPFAFGRLAA